MKALVAVLVAVVFSPFAFASAPRTFVSSSGLDTNPCSRISPCRSFMAALTQTSAGGSILVLDSAGYGPVTISQSVSLIAPEGVYAGVTATSTDAISISGTTANDVLVLRGLSIEGPGTSFSGVIILNTEVLSGLDIQRCAISRFSVGIGFGPNNGLSFLSVTDSLIRDCATAGIEHVSGGHAFIGRCHVINSHIGFWMTTAALATIVNTVVEEATTAAILASSGELVIVDHCVLTNSGIGVDSVGNATVRVANSTISDNTTGISTATGGNVLSRIGDTTYPIKTNTLEDNFTNGTFTGTFTAQ